MQSRGTLRGVARSFTGAVAGCEARRPRPAGRSAAAISGRALMLTALAGLLAGAIPAPPEEPKPAPVPIGAWLLLGPAPAPLPARHDDAAGEFSIADLLKADEIRRPDLPPRAGEAIAWPGSGSLRWGPVEARGGQVTLPAGEGGEVAFLAVDLDATRFALAEIAVRSHHLLLVEMDGKEVAKKTSATERPGAAEPAGRKRGAAAKEVKAPEPGEAKGTLQIEPGRHRLVVKTLRDPGAPFPWTVMAELRPQDAASASAVTQPAAGEQRLDLAQVLDSPQPQGVAISPDGTLAAISLRRILPGTDDAESWVEVRRVSGGSLERTYRGAALGDVAWAPSGHRLSYVTRDEGKATIWAADLDAGTAEPLLERVERFGSYAWAPDAGSLVYSASFEPDKDETGLKRLQGLQDRQDGWRTRSYLFQVAVPGGARRRLTAGDLSTDLGAFSPDGRRLIFSRNAEDLAQRPYERRDLFILDLGTLKATPVAATAFVSGAAWSPDGRKLLVTAGPSAFDGAGRAVPEGTIPNDYDQQLYLLDLETQGVTPLSRDFDPSIGSVVWHRGDGRIYVTATAGPRRLLYRVDPDRPAFTAIPTGTEVLDDLEIALDAPVAVYTGSGPAAPPRVLSLRLDGGEPSLLADPGAAAYAGVRFGKTEPWSFRSRRGATIDGLVYYPPGFDATRRYPCIVYYYGGTTPVTSEFGGRYPKDWWAANGYVVYVLQPSGAVGYGQAFSALHVNDWGQITGDDILEGVDRFLEAHPFVDPKRLGCIGASYGGFMTQYLLTRTDRFAAAVSHAGISFLGSYWGEGYWGYTYSAVASAESFPWNRGDLYVGHSPLFHADRIHTPLLLLHGDSDTNVPPGESDQLYTALKILGRPVEYVRVAGQDHHILKHAQRVLWSKTILAWFDRYLKDEPQWWTHLYPDPGKKKDKE